MPLVNAELSFVFAEDLEPPVSLADFKAALERVQSSVGAESLIKFEKWKDEFGSA